MKINTTDISSAFKKAALNTGAKLSKDMPTIMVVGGIIMDIAGTYMACKQTLKLDNVNDDFRRECDILHDKKADIVEEPTSEDDYTKKDYAKDAILVYSHYIYELLKLYGIPAAMIVAGNVMILESHKEMGKRNSTYLAAYAGLDKAFHEYRKNVASKYGEEVEKDIFYNLAKAEIEEAVVNKNGEQKIDKEGKPKVKKYDILAGDGPSKYSEYACVFDESFSEWTKDSEYNKTFLINLQNDFTDRLRSRGYLFLNEVYEALGRPYPTKAGQFVGWIYDPTGKFPELNCDNYVDFGIFDFYRPNGSDANRRFINGYERSIILDFNVCGSIVEYLGKI